MGKGQEVFGRTNLLFSQCGNYLSRFSSKLNGFVDGAAAATTSFYFSLILKDGDDWLGVMVASLNYF